MQAPMALMMAGVILAGLPAAVDAQEFRPITLMAWNVENLFDAEDDPDNPFDDTYLPKAVKESRPGHEAHCRQHNSAATFVRECIELDRTEEKLARKLEAIAAVIRAAQPQPDMIVMPEIENPAVLERLNTEFLAGLGYATVVQLDSTVTDLDRGIDVGMLSQLPLAAAATAHRVGFGAQQQTCRATRDIVQAPFTLPDGQTLHMFGVHLPSGGNPIICRDLAMRALNTARNALPADAIAIAAGDFNFPCDEAQGDLFARLMFEGRWIVPPAVRQGCDEPGSNKFRPSRPGPAWFTWSYLDFFAVSDSLLGERPSRSGWFANLGSFRTVVVTADQLETNAQGFVSPRRFNFNDATGVSDHWPIAIDLLPRQ